MYIANLITRISEKKKKKKICKGCFGMSHIIDQNIKFTFQMLTKIFPQRTISGIFQFKFW